MIVIWMLTFSGKVGIGWYDYNRDGMIVIGMVCL